ncbi:MAG: serine/threonine-protein kinase [Haliea sp.]|uniref:serine/threonine-protein kinase n=1 Tax=Haliea sp. TaxID=1932666 RepID=UPI0032EB155D
MPVNKTYEVTVQGDLPGDATELDPLQSQAPAPGMVLRDRFVLQRMLGAGGMSKVFLAIDRELEDSNPFVAIKVLGDSFKDHPQALTSLRREVNNSRQLNHPNIVGVYHFDRHDDIVFMVMEYMRGEPLDEFLRKHREGLPWDQAWHIIRGCGEALAYMHDHGVVHSDFKPGNVFLTEDNEVKVLDLGIARTLDEALATRNTTRFDGDALLALTPQYASCEMFEGQAPDRRDDIYALGCVAYLLLTGRHPFDGARAIDARSNELVAERPPGLRQAQWQALLKSLAHRRRERTAHAQEFLASFGPVIRSRSAAPWIAVTALLLVSGVAVGSWQVYRASPEQRFIDEMLVQYRDTGDSSVGAEQVALWLEQGAQNVAMASAAFANDEFDRGGYFLHGSTSSAKWVYDLVLRQAPDEASKRAAASGMLQLAAAYEEPVQRLAEMERPREALEFACRGVAINAHNPVLGGLLPALAERVPNPGVIAGCKDLPEGILR